jgi:DNA-binding NarL/FixJ family response regulator
MRKFSIAIFEDNQPFRESLEFIILSSDNLKLCGSFADTNRLVQKLETAHPDVILMDINIPGINGIDAVGLIKEKFPAMQVCMQTVFDDEDKVFASLCNGASGYILKNSTPDKLLQAIQEVAEGGAFFTPAIARKVLSNFQRPLSKGEFIELTEKEKLILKYLVDGLSYKMIADKTNLSWHTIHTHIKHIYEKMHVNSKGEAVAKALKNRLI